MLPRQLRGANLIFRFKARASHIMEGTMLLAASRFPAKRSLLLANSTAEKGISEPEPELPQGEPAPVWETARQQWGIAWGLHEYGIGAAFGVLALVSAALLALTWKRGRTRAPVLITMLILTTLFGLSRCLVLCIDAYQSKKIFPRLIGNFLWGIGNPCLVSSYALVFIVLRNAFSLRAHFQSWYTTRNIALVATIYFVFILVAELTVSFLPSQTLILVFCQVLYIIFAIFLILLYCSLFITLWRSEKHRVNRFKTGPFQTQSAWKENRTKSTSAQYTKVVIVTCTTTTAGGFALCALQIYSMVGVYGNFAGDFAVPDAWPWFGLTTAQRMLELYLSCALLATWARGTKLSHKTSSPVVAA